VLSKVLVRKATAGSVVSDTEIDLAPLGPASYVLLDVDAEPREVLLWPNDRPELTGLWKLCKQTA
jgi:hypothetical protein